jgi:hypothetical protein
MGNLLLTIAVTLLLGGAALQVILALASLRAERERRARPVAPPGPGEGLRALAADLKRFGGRLERLEQRLDERDARHARLDQPVNSPYEVAVNLARRGAGIEELMGTCNLARGEAELLGRLYGRAAAGAAPRQEPAARQ